RERGGACLSESYGGTLAKLEWRCGRGHVWRATPNTILSGCWCPKCRLRISDVEEMRAIARERGGDCISPEYVNVHTNLRWRCMQVHEWDATPGHVIHSNSWCPECAGKI